jgi:hypothetical protein
VIRAWAVRFGRFWYDFVVGDDWTIAAAVAVAVAATFGIHEADVPAWWLLPLAVVVVVVFRLRRASSAR